jgi:hypothetical protein
LICFSFWFINIGEYLVCEISKLRSVFHRNQSWLSSCKLLHQWVDHQATKLWVWRHQLYNIILLRLIGQSKNNLCKLCFWKSWEFHLLFVCAQRALRYINTVAKLQLTSLYLSCNHSTIYNRFLLYLQLSWSIFYVHFVLLSWQKLSSTGICGHGDLFWQPHERELLWK